MNDLDLLKEFRARPVRVGEDQHPDAAWAAVRDRAGMDRTDRAGAGAPHVRLRRWSICAAAAACVAAVLFASSVLLPSGTPGGSRGASAAISFREEGGYIVAVIQDPLADSEALKATFAEHGLDIALQLVPVSPSFVGKFVEQDTSGSDTGIETLFDDQADCSAPGSLSCPIGLRIPLDFHGQASIALGRAGQPGEEYVTSNDAFAYGESLHCSGLRGMTVEQALPVLDRFGVTAVWRSNDPAIDRVDGIDPSTVLDQYVTDAVGLSEGKVYVWAAPQPLPQPEPGTPLADYYTRLDRGC